jgi:hypothetical protein
MQGEEIDLFDLIPRDTTPEAYAFLVQAWRRMGPEGRLRATFEASDNLRKLAAVGVGMRHPGYIDEEVRLAVTKLMVGEKVFHELIPDIEVDP